MDRARGVQVDASPDRGGAADSLRSGMGESQKAIVSRRLEFLTASSNPESIARIGKRPTGSRGDRIWRWHERMMCDANGSPSSSTRNEVRPEDQVCSCTIRLEREPANYEFSSRRCSE